MTLSTAPIKKADRRRKAAIIPAPWEMNVIEYALVELSNVCDGANSHDNAGFNGTDTKYGKSLAEQIKGGRSLTYKQAQGAIKLLPKYKKQLTKMGLTVPSKKDFFALYKNPKRVEVIGDEIAIFVPFADRASTFFEMSRSRFEDSDKSIRVAKSPETANFIWEQLPADYQLSDEFALLVMDCGF